MTTTDATITAPMSFGQERMCLLNQLAAGSSAGNMSYTYRLRGPLDVPALERAVTELSARHEILRTVYPGYAHQRVEPPPANLLAQADLTGEPDPDKAARTRVAAAVEEPFALDTQTPVRWELLRLGADDHLLLSRLHHIATDGWSESILHGELSALYAAYRDGRDSPLPPQPTTYRAYAARQRAADHGDGLAYWRDVLAGAPAAAALPFDRPPSVTGELSGVTRRVAIPADLAASAAKLARETRSSLFTVLVSAFGVLLCGYGDRRDVVIGTPFAGRDDPDLESLVGFFINTVPLRLDLTGGPTFRELLDRTRESSLDRLEHVDVPLERIVAELAPEREPGRQPLAQVLFQVHNTPTEALSLAGLDVAQEQLFPEESALELSVSVVEEDGELFGLWEYRTDLFDDATVTGMCERFHGILGAALADPDVPVEALLAFGPEPAEAVGERVIRDRVGTTVVVAYGSRAIVEAPEPPATLHGLFEARAAADGGRVAVVDEAGSLTYAELDERAARVAAVLASHGVAPDVPVAVMLDRSTDLITGLLGVLKAGGAYVPIETDTPAARVAQLLSEAGCPVAVVEPHLAGLVAGAGGTPLTIADTAGAEPPPVPVAVDPGNLCAVYFTSGSTGRPKGVACTHEGWVNRMRWMQHRHGMLPGDAVLHKTTLTFDDAAVELFWPLLAGGRIAMLPPRLHRDPRAIVDAAVAHGAVHLNFVPAMLDFVLDTLTEEDLIGLSRLRSVLSSGEALRPDLVARFRERFGNRVSLDNTWGATEVSIDSTCHVCGPEDAIAETAAVGLGRPFDDNDVCVLDAQWRPVPAGTVGELCIGGIGLARGYLGDPARTADRFVPHPTRPGERLYRTGDRGRMLPDGSLAFLGRDDHQVKIRGVRVELGEVESVLRRCPGVADAAVIAWQATPSDKRLAAYVVLAGATVADVRGYARAQLPVYAVPGSIAAVPAMPRLTSGKLDRNALPAPDAEEERETAYRAPGTPTEEAIARIWAEVLDRERVGADDNFFAVGGHSLLAIRVITRMRRAFELPLPLSALFDRPTVAGLAGEVEDAIRAEIEALSDEEALALLG